MPIALIEPRSLLIMLDMREFYCLTLERDHIVVQLGVEGVGIAPIEVSLSVVVGIYRRVDVVPVALVPHQRLTQGILKRAVGRVGFEYGNAVSVKRSVEIVLAIALYGLDGPGSILTTAPGNILQRGHGSVFRPVHHIGGAPQEPVVHEESCRTLLVDVGNVLGRSVV